MALLRCSLEVESSVDSIFRLEANPSSKAFWRSGARLLNSLWGMSGVRIIGSLLNQTVEAFKLGLIEDTQRLVETEVMDDPFGEIDRIADFRSDTKIGFFGF
jgi:hypothetical protein